MNKPHKYIHVPDYKTGEVETRLNPKYIEYLEMLAEKYEEIKPREFEHDAFYPVIDAVGDKEIAWHDHGHFHLTGDNRTYYADQLEWIGEKLDITWPEIN